MRWRVNIGVSGGLLLLIAACGGGGGGGGRQVHSGGPSIVQLGDSVAAGEGIDYGLTYDYRFGIFPTWSAPSNPNPMWDGPYPLCHDAHLAYGNVVAGALGSPFAKFACTGASYDNGITVPEVSGGQTLRPAEFGDWATMTDLNPDYDQAKPDVVLITLGADDVHFVSIVEYCFLASFAPFQDIADMVLTSDNPADVLYQALIQAGAMLVNEIENGQAPELVPEEQRFCTADNPGSLIQQYFWDHLPALTADYAALVQGITARGQQAGHVPQIVFTTYHDPLPAADADIDFGACPDAMHLSRAQIDYLESLLDTLSDTIGAIDGVTIVEIRDVLEGHRWCSQNPWAYGPSALLLDLESQAPFHPTVQGQAAIARLVQSAIQ